jgi:hypothetical protein
MTILGTSVLIRVSSKTIQIEIINMSRSLFLTICLLLSLINHSRADSPILPACGSQEAIHTALQLGIEDRTGVRNDTLASIMSIKSSRPLGVNKQDDSKVCRVVFFCDKAKADELEKDLIGKHPMGQFCWSLNYLTDTGNGAFLFDVRPDGEGGFLIRMADENEGHFDDLWGIFNKSYVPPYQRKDRERAKAAQEKAAQQAAPKATYRLYIGQGPLMIQWERLTKMLQWQNLDQHRMIVYRLELKVKVDDAEQTLVFDNLHPGGHTFPQALPPFQKGWIQIEEPLEVVVFSNKGTFDFKPQS